MILRRFLLVSWITGIILAAVPATRNGPSKRSYSGYKVFHVVPKTSTQLEYLQSLLQDDTSMELGFWTDPSQVNKRADIMVPPKSLKNFQNALKVHGLESEVMIEDLQRSIDAEQQESILQISERAIPGQSAKGVGGFALGRYHSFPEILQFLKNCKKQYPTLVKIMTLQDASGQPMKTWEGRTIRLLKIGKNTQKPKPAFWIDSGIHAREWITIAVNLYIINDLLEGYNSNPKYKQYLDNIDFYITPVINPDGYEFSRNSDRLWRKNRNPNKGQSKNCSGVDLNRNFDWYWGGAYSSSNPCRGVYKGISVFSEPESRAVRNMVNRLKSRLQAFISLHSYAQFWMYPFGHKKNAFTKDWKELSRGAELGVQELQSYYGTKYLVGTTANVFYAFAGGSGDWAKGKCGVKYVYLLELRPSNRPSNRGGTGFILPQSQILPTAKETWGGLRIVVNEILTRNNLA